MKKIKVKLPTIMVVFGARGDLSKRKLYPAFFDLYKKGILPNKFVLLGISRSKMTNEEFKSIVRSSIKNFYGKEASDGEVDDFLDFIRYESGLFEDISTYKKAANFFIEIDKKWKVCSNKLFYLAVSPVYYSLILKNLDKSGLTIPCTKEEGWTRVLIEKPFGSDYKTAKQLDKLLGDLFLEEQIFRIDHYLAKEAIQNILAFRFSNSIFEPIWNKKYIEKVEVSLFETLDVSERGSFYDGIGALRDVGQNHILQMLSAVAMNNPEKLSSDKIRSKRAELLSSIKIPTKKEVLSFVKGQYEGYTNEKGVAKNSKTETYFKINAFIENSRWSGVPFILESGKAMLESKAEIKVYFKESKTCLCSEPHKKHSHQNILTFQIQPEQSISIRFFTKSPGLTLKYSQKEMSFKYGGDSLSKVMPDAYEKILFDCMVGDQTLFTNTKEVLTSWKFITKILDVWKDMPPVLYKKGTFPSVD